MPKPLQVEIETRFVFNERLVAVNTVARPALASIDQVNAGANQPIKGEGSGRSGTSFRLPRRSMVKCGSCRL